MPTDTLYGFSARYDRPSGIQRIAAIKGRSESDPFLLLIAQASDLALLTATPPPPAVIDRLWPGPVTVLLRARPGLPSWLISESGTVAVRLPADSLVRELIGRVGVPIVSTSVNRHGEPPLGDPAAIGGRFGALVDVIADAGRRQSLVPSTLVDLTQRPPVVLRQGQATPDMDELDRLLAAGGEEGRQS